MNATVTLEHRFSRTPDGTVWTQTAFPYAFWQRYLAVYDRVRIAARVLDVKEVAPAAKRVEGPGVTVFAIPHYHGPTQFGLQFPAIRKALRQAVANQDAVIMRVPSFLSLVLEPMLQRDGRPYSLEVVGDPYEVFAPGVIKHPLRPLIRHYLTRALQQQCRRAAGVAYVTKAVLQRRYPCSSLMTSVSDVELRQEAFCTHYSSIELSSSQLLDCARETLVGGHKATIAFVGSLEQLYKGPDVLLKSVAQCVQCGLDLEVLMVGDGHYRPFLESLAQDLGIGPSCRFLGQLTAGAAVQNVLDSADLFVLPSLTEGLPRAMIEAMARSLPCIGSRVGGIPELLADEDMVRPGDVNDLAAKMQEFLSDPQRLTRASERNNRVAREYVDEVLQRTRTEFYMHTKQAMARWMSRHMCEAVA